MRAFLMQSSLENSAVALSIMKGMAQSKAPTHYEGQQEDNDGEDEAMQHLLHRFDILIAQNRSAKVVSSKAVHQLQELQSRSLTLDPSTLPSIRQSQLSINELVSVSRQSGLSLFNVINEEGRTSPFTYDEILKAIDSADKSPLSNISSILNTATNQIQDFQSLTTNLSQCIEFASPGPAPWELLSQKLRAASTTSASYEKAVERLKGELSDKIMALTMKDKILDELKVNVEVLEKRARDSNARREKLKELEGIVDTSACKEKEMAKRLSRLEQDLQALQAERNAWEHRVDHAESHTGSREIRGPDETISMEALEGVTKLKAEIEILRSTIRHLRLSSYQKSINSSHSFLTAPLVAKAGSTERTHLALEAQDILKSMVTLITRPENQMVELKAASKSDRLGWRPARQTMKWQVARQREEWEGWQDWRDDVAKRSREMNARDRRKKMVQKQSEEVIAKTELRLAGLDPKVIGEAKEVRIVRPGDWEDVDGLRSIA